MKRLFDLFKNYYYETNNTDLTISCKSFSNDFKTYCNYSFKQYQIDICNFCIINSKNPDNLDIYEIHLLEVTEYNLLKIVI